MTRALVDSSRFSPGNMNPEALERLFVGRAKLMDEILKHVASAATGGEKHFMLLVGPRGMGKTHFMALLHHRLMTRPALAQARDKLKIAYLREEEWGVASYLDFLIRILRALASRDARLQAPLDRIPQIYARDAQAALREAEKLLIDHVGDGVLLLLCENLNDLFAGLGEEGQRRFRAFIHEHPFWTIVATTPGLFLDVQRQRWPFYGFFTIRYLDRLDIQTATELLARKAQVEGKTDLADFLRTPTGQARVRAIHHLAGGNHRVYVILSDFLDRQSLDDLVTPFLRMVDDLTPYYQDRMRQLAPQQRKIVEYLCHQSRPLPVKEIALACLMSQQTAAKQLGELARLGFVLRSERGRETLCEIAEPLMRICIEVKDNQTSHLKLFVEFLRRWFTRREMEVRFAQIPATDHSHHVDRLHLGAAIEECREDFREPFLDALTEEASSRWERDDYIGLADAAERLVQDRGEADDYRMLVTALRRCGRETESIARGREGVRRHPRDGALRAAYAQTLFEAERCDEALKQTDRALKLLSTGGALPARCLRGQILLNLERFDEALANEAAILAEHPGHLHTYRLQASALIGLERYAEAEAIAREGLASGKDQVYLSIMLGQALRRQQRYAEAIEAFDRALALDEHSSFALCNRTRALVEAGRFGEAAEDCERMRRMDEGHFDSPHFASRYLDVLLATGRWAEAEAVARKLLDSDKDRVEYWNRLGSALVQQDRDTEALQALGRALDLDPNNQVTWLIKLGLLSTLQRWQELLEIADDQLKKGNHAAHVWLSRAEAFVGLRRYDEALVAANHAREARPDDIVAALIHCRATVGAAGLAAALNALSALLQLPPSLAPMAALAIAEMMYVELRERGPVALARQIPLLRKTLESQGHGTLLAEAFTQFVQHALELPDLGSPDWSLALGHFTVLRETESLRIPIDLLEAAIRHRSGEPGALLALPLEQRQLIERVLAKTRETPSVKESPSLASAPPGKPDGGARSRRRAPSGPN